MPLSANYIAVKCRNEEVYQYAVTFSPVVDSLAMRRKIMHGLIDIIGPVYAFHDAILFLPIKLGQVVSARDSVFLVAMSDCTGWK